MNRTLRTLIPLLLLSFNLPGQTPTAADCLGALSVCQEVITEPSPGSNAGNYPNEINASTSCTSGEDNSIWYTFTANANGFLNFVITPDDPNDDYDWALFDITNANCGDIFSNPSLEVSCNAAGGDPCHGPTGPTGATTYNSQGGGCGTDPPSSSAGFSPFNDQVPMQAGNTYVLMVSNWTGSPNGYTIDFSNSTDIGILDQVNPELQTAEFPLECDDNTINITFSENIQCSTINDFNFQLTGTGGPYTVTLSSPVCDQGGNQDRFFELTVSPPLPAVGNYTLNLFTNGSTEVLDLCGNPAGNWSGNFSTNNELDNAPTLNPDQVTVCEGEPVSISPIGNNGIPSPSFNFYSDVALSNLLASGSNYSFTASTSMSIWVTEFSSICESPPTVFTLTVNPVPPPPDAIDPPSVCAGSPILNLIANGSGGTINWYLSDPSSGNPPSIGTGSPFSPMVNTDTPGAIIFWVNEITAAGCVSGSDAIAVIITPLPTPPFTNPVVSICVNDDIPQLEAFGNETINWYDTDPALGTPPSLGTGTFFTPNIDNTIPGTTTFWMNTIDDLGCIGAANQTIIAINPSPELLTSDLNCAADLQTYVVDLTFLYVDNISVNAGNVQNNGGGSFTISGIDISTNLVLTATDQSSGCNVEFSFSAPNCGCPNVDPPISDGDVQICEGDAFPALSVSVGAGETADWYDAAVDGNLLLAGNTSYTPTAAGTYFAETHIIGGDCTSTTRTAVTVSINPTPVLTDTIANCSADLLTYSLSLDFTNADSLVISEGNLVNNGGGSFDISGILSGNIFTATAINSTTLCTTAISINPPACDCPDVDAPISNGDIIICAGDSIPSFSVTVGAGETVDWYDAAVGGTLLLSDSTLFTPTVADTFYAETRVIVNNCTSMDRTALVFIINPLPVLIDSLKNCSADLLTYSLTLSFDNTDSLTISEGVLENTGGGNFTITGIDVNNNFTVTAIDTSTFCTADFTIEAPDCDCSVVNAPINDGDLEMCPSGGFPTLSVSIGVGETVDWYDAAIGGTLLLQGSNTYTPTAIGTYFAETRVLNNGCISDTRTAVILSEYPLPTLTSAQPDCAADLLSYSLVLTFLDADSIGISEGNVVNNGNGNFSITNIDINNSLLITAFNTTTSCTDDFVIDPPDCACLDVIAPVNDGDLAICEGETLPILSVSVGIGETVDWYDALIGGNLILASSTTFTPTAAGTYFAETRVINSGCTSSVRTDVNLTINPLPVLTDTLSTCSADLLTYSLTLDFSDTDDLTISEGNLTNNGGGSFTITGIDINNTFSGTATNTTTSCTQDFSISPPNCPCPDIAAPVNNGDTEICSGGIIPNLSVSVGTDETVDWYDAAVGGTLLSQNSTSFLPIIDGTYFAETRSTINNCVSNIRTPVTFTIHENPTLAIVDSNNPGCGLTNGTIEVNAITGQVPFMYQIDNNPLQAIAEFIGLDANVLYNFTVEDGNGCVGTTTSSLNAAVGPTAIISGLDVLTCNTTNVQLDAGATTADGGLVFEWVYNNEIISDFIQVDISEPGMYILNAIQDGCISSDTVTVEQNLSTTIIADIQSEIALDCNIAAVALDGTGSSTGLMISYQWFFEGNLIIGETGNTYDASEAGLYTIEVTDNLTGCSFTDEVLLINNESYPVANAGSDQILNCIIENVNLDGSNSQNGASIVFQWFDENSDPIPGANTNTWTVSVPGTYTLQVSDSNNGCANEDIMLVTGDYTPPIAEAGEDKQLDCNEETLDLNGIGSSTGTSFSYSWEGEIAGNILSGNTSLNPNIGATGVYFLTVTNTENGCTATDFTTVTKIDGIQTTISVVSENEKCIGENNGFISLMAEDPNAQILYAVNGAPFIANTQFLNLTADTYNIIAEDSNGCQWDTTIIIQPGVDLSVDLGPDIFIHLGDSTQLDATLNISQGTITSIIWTNANLLNCESCLNPSTSLLPGTTSFSLSITDENNCFASDELTVFVDKTRQVYIPNAFSPNDDGINDLFVIHTGNDVARIKSFIVFDRWGESVFEVYGFNGNDTDFGWNGKYRNQQLNTGIYVYAVEIEFIDGETKIYAGDVLLMK